MIVLCPPILSTSLVFDLPPHPSLDFMPAGAHREAHLVSPEAQLLNLGFVIAGQVRNATIIPVSDSSKVPTYSNLFAHIPTIECIVLPSRIWS